MNLKTVAECVESQEILAKVREIGLDYAQGNGISKPRPLQAPNFSSVATIGSPKNPAGRRIADLIA
jgi:EAL domain-containing protein (putative c-di-GMP-specific phosphodiesterase class I)